MSTETEDQNTPSSTNLDSKDLTEEEIAASDETSLEDDWAAALAEQRQAEAEPPVAEDTTSVSKTEAQPEAVSQNSSDEEKPPSTDASLENDWAAVLEDQEQPQPEAQQAETAPTENDPASDDSSQVGCGARCLKSFPCLFVLDDFGDVSGSLHHYLNRNFCCGCRQGKFWWWRCLWHVAGFGYCGMFRFSR